MRFILATLLFFSALQAGAEMVTETFSIDAEGFVCTMNPNDCPDVPEAEPPVNQVTASFTATYDNNDFNRYQGPIDQLDLTIAGHTYDVSDVVFRFEGSCYDMYSGVCNPFGPTYDLISTGGIDVGVNTFWIGFGGTTSELWEAGGIVWYSTDGAIVGWRDSKLPGSKLAIKLVTNVQINVEPWDGQNRVYPDANGTIKVGLLSSSIANGEEVDFDANQVDTSSLKFGPTESTATSIFPQIDFNSDGNPDLMASFATADTGIVCEDNEVTLSGVSNNGAVFSATDVIQTEDCAASGCHP